MNVGMSAQRPNELVRLRIRIGLLGPVTAASDQELITIPGERQRKVLASLALSPGQAVPVDRLIQDSWGEQPPRTAAGQLQTSIWMLRRALTQAGAPHGAVLSHGSSYQLDRAAFVFDTDEFRAAVREAGALHRHGLPEQAVERLNAALGLWRGPALANVTSPALQARATRLEEERLAALEQRISLDIEAGRYEQAIGELYDLVSQHPFREGCYADLMLALYWSGRQADALAVFRAARTTLSEELGISPGPRLTGIEGAILRQDSASLQLCGA